MYKKNARMKPNKNRYSFSFIFSVKIHDLTELRDMYAIINLDDENKGIDLGKADLYFVIVVTENNDCCMICILIGRIKLTPFCEAL